MFTDAVGQFMGSKTAVTHKDDLALRKPPNGLEHALSGPVCEFFVLQSTFTGIAFRLGEKRLNGSALMPVFHGNGVRSVKPSHRKPLVLTK